MQVRQVFIVGQDVKKSTAEKLGKHFYPSAQIQSPKLSDDAAFESIHQDNCGKLVFLGHGDGHEYGDYHPKAFAKRLAHLFRHKKNLRSEVKDLYLVGCDMGLVSEDHSALAQSIADELVKHGFKNARVHAIAKPEGAVGQALYVEVITQASRFDLAGTTQEGYLNAFLLSEDDSEKYTQIKQSGKANQRALAAQFKDEHAFVFLQGVNPLTELNKPQHTFVAKETLEERHTRIANSPLAKQSRELEAAIALLEKRRHYEAKKSNRKDFVQTLDFVINQMKLADASAWQTLLRNYKKYLEVKVLGVALNRKSNTLKLINALCEGDIEAAEQLVHTQEKPKEHKLDKAKNMVKKKVLEKQAKHHDKPKKEDDERQPLLSDTDGGGGYPRHQSVFSDSRNEEPVLRQGQNNMLRLSQMKEAVKKMANALEDEIERLQQGCLPFTIRFFDRYEANTKTQKMDALRGLLNETTLENFQSKACQLMNNTRVMRSMKTSRVRDLLDDIVNHPDAFTIDKGYRHLK